MSSPIAASPFAFAATSPRRRAYTAAATRRPSTPPRPRTSLLRACALISYLRGRYSIDERNHHGPGRAPGLPDPGARARRPGAGLPRLVLDLAEAAGRDR